MYRDHIVDPRGYNPLGASAYHLDWEHFEAKPWEYIARNIVST